MPKTSSWPDDYQGIMQAFCKGYRSVVIGERVDINPSALAAGLKEVVKHLESQEKEQKA